MQQHTVIVLRKYHFLQGPLNIIIVFENHSKSLILTTFDCSLFMTLHKLGEVGSSEIPHPTIFFKKNKLAWTPCSLFFRVSPTLSYRVVGKIEKT